MFGKAGSTFPGVTVVQLQERCYFVACLTQIRGLCMSLILQPKTKIVSQLSGAEHQVMLKSYPDRDSIRGMKHCTIYGNDQSLTSASAICLICLGCAWRHTCCTVTMCLLGWINCVISVLTYCVYCVCLRVAFIEDAFEAKILQRSQACHMGLKHAPEPNRTWGLV